MHTTQLDHAERAPVPARNRLLIAALVLAFAGAVAWLIVAQPLADAMGGCGGG